MKHFLILALLLAPVIAERSEQAWQLSGNGSKPVECYFWATKSEVSVVACQPLKRPTNEIAVTVPRDALYFYHTHPRGFPQLSDQDKAAARKTGIKIIAICH